ncbi:MAG: trypsin-like peptidase domain-containing protein [Planctomycetota bacterium]|nr:trypsin-like peptidase domain-containing protein [Planctomycetota bacterium]
MNDKLLLPTGMLLLRKGIVAIVALGILTIALPAAADVDPAVLKSEAQRIEVVKNASAATLAVFGQGGTGGGSGVVITPDGYALSNFHVTQPSGNAMKCGMADGKLYDAVIVGIDPTGDVALIKLFGRDDFPTAPLGDSDQVRVGDWAFAIGNPFLLATDLRPTVSYGVISGVHRYQYPAGTLLEYADCIQTDAAINPGNSGGPLFNAHGELIGINGRGSFEKRGRVNVGVGYAISINQIKHFLGYLRSGRIVDHATLGATVASDEDERPVVVAILDSSDAYRRGLRLDDEIIKFGGRTIHTANGFKNVLGIYPKGWRVPLTYRRDGQTHQIIVRLHGVHSAGELANRVAGKPRKPPTPGDKDKDPGDKDKKPRLPKKLPKIKLPKKQPLPKIVKEHFQQRKGFANYYFNEIHQQRVWKAFAETGDFAALPRRWTISGSVTTHAGAGGMQIVLATDRGEAVLPDFHAKAAFDDNLAESLDPPGSGGLLIALHLWKRLLQRGIQDFGDIYYLGTAPLVGHDELVDVLVGTHAGVEAHFMFDPRTGRLLAVETFPDDDVDPCEVYFDDYGRQDDSWLPRQFVVRHGDRQFGAFLIEGFQFDEEQQP